MDAEHNPGSPDMPDETTESRRLSLYNEDLSAV